VADDGPGIPEDKLGDFLARTRPSPYIASCDGAGLGLFLTKRSADAIGVALSVRNGEGRGTVASLEFPAELLEVGAVS
jgi:signal transduction histidine kinase